MTSKTTFLTGIAALTLMSAPAFAQDAMTPPTPAPAASTPAPAASAPAAAAAQPGTLQLQPGSDVKGSDGVVIGKLEGVRNNSAGEQELTVRGTDGQLRGVPLGGLKPEGSGVSVGWSSAEYLAAPAIAAPATPTATAPAAAPASSEAAPTEGTAQDGNAPEATPPTASTDPADADPATAQEPKTEDGAMAPEPKR